MDPPFAHDRVMIALILSVLGALRTRADLAIDDLALRQQLANPWCPETLRGQSCSLAMVEVQQATRPSGALRRPARVVDDASTEFGEPRAIWMDSCRGPLSVPPRLGSGRRRA